MAKIFSYCRHSIKNQAYFLKKYVKYNSTNIEKKYVSKKWEKGSLFDRIQKIEEKVEFDENSPIEFLFPNTKKRFEFYVPENLRSGAIGIKLGLTHLWRRPEPKQVICTMIHIKDCEVLEHIVSFNSERSIKKNTLIVGAANVSNDELIYLNEKQRNYFKSLGVHPKSFFRGYLVHSKNILPAGTKINARHFTVGQKVSVVSRSKDKGFLGAMQRWGYSGSPMSHGISKKHRSPGSLCTPLIRVLPRKKMAGHHGLQLRSTYGTEILRINPEYNVIYVRGTIPGPVGQVVSIRDWFTQPKTIKLQFPTVQEANIEIKEELFAENIHNPAELYAYTIPQRIAKTKKK